MTISVLDQLARSSTRSAKLCCRVRGPIGDYR